MNAKHWGSRWAPPILTVALIYTLSLQPTVPVPGIPGVDKVLHAIEYGWLGLWLIRALGVPAPTRRRWIGIAIGVAVGIVDEWIQSHVPGRDATVWDLMADAVGTILGIGAGNVLWTRHPWRRLA